MCGIRRNRTSLATDLQSAPGNLPFMPEAPVGVEPRLRIMSPANYHYSTSAVAVGGIEPPMEGYESSVIPFNYTADVKLCGPLDQN